MFNNKVKTSKNNKLHSAMIKNAFVYVATSNLLGENYLDILLKINLYY